MEVLEAFGAERTFGFVERLVDLFRALVENLTDLLSRASVNVDRLTRVLHPRQ